MKDSNGPIDAVVLWVDGSDPSWRLERFNQWKIYFNQCIASNADHRFANCDELVYCLRSLHYHAPWIRNIYLVTCGQRPKWLDLNHPKIKLINHRQIMDAEHLPTFNSCSIEMCLHRIPGLSDCFLYLNDDCFITKRTTKKHFFHSNGKAYFTSHRLMQNPPNCNEINSFNWTIRNNQECLDQLFGKKIRNRPDHQAYLVYKRACLYVERNAPEYVKNTRQHKFRVDSTKGEKAVNMYVFATAGLDLGYYELRLNGDELYYTIDQAKENYQRILADIPMLLCINNAHTDSDRLFIHQLMSSILPKPAPWEIPNSFPKYTPLRSNKVAICGTTGPTNPIKVPRFIRPADQIISLTHRLFESNFPKNNRRVVYQLKNSKETKDSKQTNPSIHTVNFYLPPKYVNTQVNKMRVNPTSINKNKTKLYHHIGQYKASRNLMSIPH